MVTIQTSSLRSNIYETIYDELVSQNLLSSTATVTAAYIDSDSAFPQVVINPARVSKDTFSYDRVNNVQTIQVDIEVYTKKAIQLDQLTDEMDFVMNALKIQSLQLIDTSEDLAFNVENDNKIHQKTITYTYRRG